MSSVYKVRDFEKKKITVADLKSVQDVFVVEEVKKCFGVSTSIYFIFDETWDKKLSLEIGCSQGLVYGFTRYDDNHERANKLISFLGKKEWKVLKYFTPWDGMLLDCQQRTMPSKHKFIQIRVHVKI